MMMEKQMAPVPVQEQELVLEMGWQVEDLGLPHQVVLCWPVLQVSIRCDIRSTIDLLLLEYHGWRRYQLGTGAGEP